MILIPFYYIVDIIQHWSVFFSQHCLSKAMPEIPVPKPRAGKTQDSEDEEEEEEKKETKEKDKKKDKKKGGGCQLELLELL